MDIDIEEVLKNNIKINNLYMNVEKKLKEQGKILTIFVGSEDNPGLTINESTEVTIALDRTLKDNNKKLIAIFIHELGEADYIANKLPFIEGSDWNPLLRTLTECITHFHVNRVVDKYNLNKEMEYIYKYQKDISIGENRVENLINLLHIRITHMLKDDYFESVTSSYSEYKDIINEIVKILQNIETIDIEDKDVKRCENEYMKLIEVIGSVSKDNKITLKSRLISECIK